MLVLLLPITALLCGIALLLLGTGLLNTLLALRGAGEGFSDQWLGLLGSAYFVGFIFGTWLGPGLIRRMGHIRAFAFFAAATAACVLVHVLIIDPWVWLLLRVITGLMLVGIYTVIESWLNSQAPPAQRGRIFAAYMAVNLLSLALAQQFLHLASPMLFTLFALAAVLMCLAVLPVVATRLPQPVLGDSLRLSLGQLWRAAPVACAGSLLSGLAMGAFWGLMAVYVRRIGLAAGEVAGLVSLVILAGALAQWPLGLVSDRLDRRLALSLIAALAVSGALLLAAAGSAGPVLMLAAVLFGAGAFAVYPAVVAHMMDHLQQEDILPGNAALLMLHAVGAAIGPALAGWLMGWWAVQALPLFFAVIFAMTAGHAWQQWRQGKDRIVEVAAHYVPMLRTSPAVLEMMLDEAPASQPQNSPRAAGEDQAVQPGAQEKTDAVSH